MGHLKLKEAPLFRNVGETWVETWAERARVWNPWWHGLVLGFAKGLRHANILWKLVKPFQMCTYLLLGPLQNVF